MKVSKGTLYKKEYAFQAKDGQEIEKQRRSPPKYRNQSSGQSGHPLNIITEPKGETSPVKTTSWQYFPQPQLAQAQDNSSLDHIAHPHSKNGGGTELNVQSTMNMSQQKINDTIEKIQTLQATPANNKCSLALFCNDTRITLPHEMSIDDICYIKQEQLTRAKNFFKHNQPEDSSIIH